jgi:hypothetical protein
MDKDFHRRNLEEIVTRLERRSESNIAAVEEDLEIQQRRLDEIIELAMQSDSPSLKIKILEQSKKIDYLRTRVAETVEEDKLLEFAHQQYETMQDAGFLNGYFGWIYQYAIEVLKMEHPDDKEKMTTEIVNELVKMFERVLSEAIEPLRKIYNNPRLEWEDLASLKMKNDDDFQMKTLRAMGLDHIKVTWELGLWRGKPRRVPTEMLFAFSLAPEEYTDKGLLFISKRSAVFSGWESS